MRMLISYFHDMILSVSCSTDDRDRRSVMANEYENNDQLLSYVWEDRSAVRKDGGWPFFAH